MVKEYNGITYSKVLLKRGILYLFVCWEGWSLFPLSPLFSVCVLGNHSIVQRDFSKDWLEGENSVSLMFKSNKNSDWLCVWLNFLRCERICWRQAVSNVSCSSRCSLYSLACHWSDLLNPCASADFRNSSETWVRKWIKNFYDISYIVTWLQSKGWDIENLHFCQTKERSHLVLCFRLPHICTLGEKVFKHTIISCPYIYMHKSSSLSIQVCWSSSWATLRTWSILCVICIL